MTVETYVLLSFAGVFILTIVTDVASRFRARTLLRRWAARSGYHLIDHEYCLFWKGPFFVSTSNSQLVYYITVQDKAGKERRGYIRCGSWFLGLWSDQVEVRWDGDKY